MKEELLKKLNIKQKNDKFYCCYPSLKTKFKLADDAKPMKIKGFDLDLFYVKFTRGYYVTEAITGLSMGKDFPTLRDAKVAIAEKVNKHGLEAVAGMVVSSVNTFGLSPRYTKIVEDTK